MMASMREGGTARDCTKAASLGFHSRSVPEAQAHGLALLLQRSDLSADVAQVPLEAPQQRLHARQDLITRADLQAHFTALRDWSHEVGLGQRPLHWSHWGLDVCACQKLFKTCDVSIMLELLLHQDKSGSCLGVCHDPPQTGIHLFKWD